MKVVIKLLLVAIVLNAMWRIGSTYWAHYRFVDETQDVVQLKASRTEAEVQDRVLALASQHGIPVTDANLTISTTGQHTYVRGSYTRPVEVFPGFKYVWPFTIDVDVMTSLPAPPK